MAVPGSPVDSSNISNLRDIMMTYNKITENCFRRCISSLNSHTTTDEEAQCLHRCSGKYITGNQRIMATFMEVQGRRQKALIEEAEERERQHLAGGETSTPQLPGPTAANLLFSNHLQNQAQEAATVSPEGSSDSPLGSQSASPES